MSVTYLNFLFFYFFILFFILFLFIFFFSLSADSLIIMLC